RCPMARGRELTAALLRSREDVLGLVETPLLEQRAAEDDLRISDLVEVVDPPVEQLQRVPGLLLGQLDRPRAEVNLGERGDGVCCVDEMTELEGDSERVF